MPPHRRRLTGPFAILLGALGLLAGALLSDAARLLRPDAFADRVAASLADERVARVAADQLTEAVLAQNRDLTALRPLVLAASADVVRSGAFRGIVRGAARRAHAAVFSSMGRSVVLSLPDLQVVLRGVVSGAPALAARVPDVVQVGVSRAGEHPAARALREVARSGVGLGRYAPAALVLGAVLLIVGVLQMPDRRDALVAAGAALIAVGAALWALVRVGEAVVARLPADPRLGDAAAGLWTVALAGVPAWGLAYGGIGVVLAAAGSSLLERLDVPELARRLHDVVVTPPRRRRVQLARGLGLTALGLVAVAAPRATLTALVAAAGLGLAFVGLREVFAVVLHAAPADRRLGRAVRESGEGWAVGGVLVVLLAAVFAAAIAVTSRATAAGRAPTIIDVCNGAAALCDRRLDEVVLAGTHNAMSAADAPGWLFAQQERGISTQLADGVRALLLDVHAGTPVGDRVRTVLDVDLRAREAERLLGPEGVAAAMRIRDRLVRGAEGPRGLYLCHGFCELGAARLDSALGAIRDFLVQHPNEVLVLVVEDYVPPAELAAAFAASGLADFVHRAPIGPRWPTLREMIAADARVVVLIESGRPGVPWLRPAFGVLQETPYAFHDARDTLSCAPNRGGTSGSLLLLNHWIETTPAPRPSNAAVLNAAGVLLERARRCERARGRRPNIIAVDFYRTGGLLAATRALNGAGRPGLP